MDLATILAAANAAATPRAPRAARTPGAGRKPSLAARMLADLAAKPELHGTALPLNVVADAWAAENHPAGEGKLTPDATIESQVRTLAKAGALPTGWTLTSAKDNAAAGRARLATITYNA